MKKLFNQISMALYQDELNRISLLITAGVAFLCYFIWHKLTLSENFVFFTPYGYYPLQILLLVWLMHVFISIYSYKINKNISYILINAPIFYLILIFILEMYYWTSL